MQEPTHLTVIETLDGGISITIEIHNGTADKVAHDYIAKLREGSDAEYTLRQAPGCGHKKYSVSCIIDGQENVANIYQLEPCNLPFELFLVG